MPDFKCDLSQTPQTLNHSWEHTLGSGHATLALRADWQAQLKRTHTELGIQHVRFHGILDDDMGTLITQNDQPLYSFFNADAIMDFLLSIGMRPFVELSFMPWTLASGEKIVFHYKAHVTPPNDYNKWATLIGKLVEHWVDRYGLSEVRQWFFEVWNEPNLTAFWTANPDDYFTLYRYTVEAIKGVDKELQVGGPVTATAAWIPEFLDFCDKNNLPTDFVSTHYYPTDALGVIGSDTLTQLASAPRDVMRTQAETSFKEARGHPLYYTEWNASSNPRDPLHDQPYTAAFVTKTVMEVDPFVKAYSFWTFSDIFEENYFPSVPFHGGFGLLNLHGIAKPSYRAYQLLHHLGKELFIVEGTHETVNVWVVRKETSLSVLMTNHAFPRHPVQTEAVHISISGATCPIAAFVEQVDEDHANAPGLWMAMGQPEYLSSLQLSRLHEASALSISPHPWKFEDDIIQLDFSLPPHGVAAITLEWAPQPPRKEE